MAEYDSAVAAAATFTGHAAGEGAGWADGSGGPGRRKDPAQVAAGKRRRPWGAEDRERPRRQCLGRRPWLRSTGPVAPAGEARPAANGRHRRPEPGSVRQLRAGLADVARKIGDVAKLRRLLLGR